MAKAKGIVTYFDPYDGYGYIVPDGKKSDEAVAFSYKAIESQMVQAVRANELVEFDTDDDNPRQALRVVRVKEATVKGKKAAAKTTKTTKAAKAATAKKAAAAKKVVKATKAAKAVAAKKAAKGAKK